MIEWDYDIPYQFIRNREEAVECSFIFQSTLTRLDLSLREYSTFQLNLENGRDERSVVLTEEAVRKRYAPDRRILYDYHLDVLKEFELNLRDVRISGLKFYSRIIVNNFDAENPDKLLDQMILDALGTTNENVKIIHSVCRMARRYVARLPNSCRYLRANGLNELRSQNADPIVVVDILTFMQFSREYFLELDYKDFEFVLQQANQARFNLWTALPNFVTMSDCAFRTCPKIIALLKYHNDFRCCNRSYIEIRNKANRLFAGFKQDLECPVENGLITRERHLRILEISHVARGYCKISKIAMLMLWRSIPDSFIIMKDLTCVFDRNINETLIQRICEFSRDVIGVEITEENTWQTRTLKQHSRVRIRNILCNNFQLSTGIDQLIVPAWTTRLELPNRVREPVLPPEDVQQNLPEIIKKYLKLEHW